MKVLQITPGYFPEIGGVQRHVQAISEHLAGAGHEVQVAAMAHRDEGPALEIINGIEIRRFYSMGVREAYRVPAGFLYYLARVRDDFDVIHVHNYHASMIPLTAALASSRLVVTPHLNDRPHNWAAGLVHAPYALLGRWSLRRARAVVCVSDAERKRVSTRLGVPRAKTVVIPNGVDDRVFRQVAPEGGRDPYLLLSVGRLEPYKRIEDGITALASLPEAYRLAVIGQGPHQAALEARARECGVAGRVEFAGCVPDRELDAWYRRAQVSLSLSTAEAFGMTVLEAIAGGCQVVCSDIPAFRDLATRFPDFVTVAPSTVQDTLAAAVLSAANRPGQPRPDLEAYTWKAVVEKLVEVYERYVGEGQSPASPDSPSAGEHDDAA